MGQKPIPSVEKIAKVIFHNKGMTYDELYEQLKWFYQAARKMGTSSRIYRGKTRAKELDKKDDQLPL